MKVCRKVSCSCVDTKQSEVLYHRQRFLVTFQLSFVRKPNFEGKSFPVIETLSHYIFAIMTSEVQIFESLTNISGNNSPVFFFFLSFTIFI